MADFLELFDNFSFLTASTVKYITDFFDFYYNNALIFIVKYQTSENILTSRLVYLCVVLMVKPVCPMWVVIDAHHKECRFDICLRRIGSRLEWPVNHASYCRGQATTKP